MKHGMCNTRLYLTWKHMKYRCLNPKAKDYKYYGGRGIKVCEEWLEFIPFMEWAYKNGYNDELEIDRINNDGNYEPSNCQLVTRLENMEVGKRGKYSNNTSGYIGVSYFKNSNKWASRLQFKGKQLSLGHYNTVEEALKARINKEIELFGEQKTNKMEV